MKDFVSARTLCVGAIIAMSMTWGVLVGALGRPTAGPWSVALIGLCAIAAALWVGLGPARSMARVISDVEAEPQLATVKARRTS